MLTYYVYATDKLLSGWGMAKGKIHKQVIICKGYEEYCRIYWGMLKCKDEFKNIDWQYKMPYFRPSRYTVTVRDSTEWTRFIKK